MPGHPSARRAVRQGYCAFTLLGSLANFWKGVLMDININEEVQAQLDQVKEWMESKVGREVTYNEVILQILKNFQSVLYPEDLGSA
jgi:hypothetical protein